MAIDFLIVSARTGKRGTIEIYPKFIIKKSSDLMIRGGDFYAIWIEARKLWSTDEQDALGLIDEELDNYAKQNKNKFDCAVKVLHMWDAESGMIDSWHKYCQKQMRDSFHILDENIFFLNDKTNKNDYASKHLNYPLIEGDFSAWDKLISVLYSEEERHKIEWAIGSIVCGDSRKLQKFVVLYGAAGTGKSTVLNIIQQLFDGYFSVFDAKALGSHSNSFALEAFRGNPLVAIQHDGDLSKIEDNTRLNSLVSHEVMTVNEKFKSTYSSRFNCFLFMGTNKPVRITDARSGLIRRLIDVSPTGETFKSNEYKRLVSQIKFQLGPIAYHCKEVYLKDPDAYENYIPTSMLGASNDFYNFVLDSWSIFKKNDGTTLKAAWEMYKSYCDEARVSYPLPQRIFKEELKNYFKDFKERFILDDGSRVRSFYSGFISEKFQNNFSDDPEEITNKRTINFSCSKSLFDDVCGGYFAQYATSDGIPMNKWAEVTTTLSCLDTSRLHYVKIPENHIVIDFDITDEEGEKSFERNLEEASKWPPTYAELSKSGKGIHLHYIYSGDSSKLCSLFKKNVEIKVFFGNSSLRRKLTKCNDIPIAEISSGLPLKGETKVINFSTVKSERDLRNRIKKNLNKEIHPNTKPSIDFIKKILDDAYESGLNYDISDMRNAILAFAAGSSHQADYCIKLVKTMQFKSDEQSASISNEEKDYIFFDVEVFPNLFVVCWKKQGKDRPVVKMINPKPADIEDLIQHRLIGFNCRRYDNHILYAALMGYTTEQLYELSQKIINKSPNCFFGEAYNISYTDIYNFSSEKQSLKKFEIALGIHHQELGLPWDKSVPESEWDKVADYCVNDVIATEAVFNARQSDFTARQILADVAGMTVNDTTNSLTTRIIFGDDRKPQEEFNYRNMAETSDISKPVKLVTSSVAPGDFNLFDRDGKPIFPEYKFESGISTYRGEEVGEGGYVYAEPGIYSNIALLDIASMHPSSIIAENLFGDIYTKRFKELVNARIAIKHGDFESAGKMLGGRLAKYLTDKDRASDLAKALKIAINSVYGLTAASFDNPFRDVRNIDNIVAKRGALFMVNLKHEVQKRGFTVAHIKTDSIKIPNATKEIIQFVKDFGEEYGYTFEHEATYDRMCLVNDAVYIAKYDNGEWTATGTQFQVPYVFKTLFSKEPIGFEDMCETKSVTSALYLDMNEGLPDVTMYEVAKSIRESERNGKDSFTKKENDILKSVSNLTDDDLQALIDEGHSYHFVGKVGLFCPIKEGRGGGQLLWKKDDKYYAVNGTKGYRWMEASMAEKLDKTGDVDESYYDILTEKARNTISKYGDFDQFVSGDILNGNNILTDESLPF